MDLLYQKKSNEDQLKECIDQFDEYLRIIKNPRKFRSEWQIAGERSLWNKDYDRAIEYFTRALQETVPMSKASANLYYTRANAFKNLQLYKDSLLDMERVFELLHENEFLMPYTWKNEKTELTEKVACIEHTKKDKMNYWEEVPVLSYGKKSHIPGYSDAIELVYDPKYGRHFRATRLIFTGDIILVDKSELSQLSSLPIVSRHACHHCFKYCRALLPCDCCTYATYCSKECREEANREYHEIECDFENFTSSVHFAVKLLVKITQNGSKLPEAIEYCEELDAMDAGSEEFLHPDNVKDDNLKAILNLSARMKNNDARYSSIFDSAKAASILRCFPSMRETKSILSLAKLLLRLCYIYDTQAYCIDVATNEEPIITTHNLYPLLRLVRHSCCANTIFSLHRSMILALRAAKNINPGEKITFNFLDKSMACWSDRESREFILEENDISCDCKACIQHCDFKPASILTLKIPEHLLEKLLKCRIDIDSMWELLEIMNSYFTEPSMNTEILKASISNAYQGKEFFMLPYLYRSIEGLQSLIT